MALTQAEKVLMRLLYRALVDLTERCDGEEGVVADGSNIQTYQAHAAIEAVQQYERDVNEQPERFWMPARERYMNDNTFHRLVDVMVAELRDLRYTPTELREAVILAATITDQINPRAPIVSMFKGNARENFEGG